MFAAQAMVEQNAYGYLTAQGYQRTQYREALLGSFAQLTAASALIRAGIQVIDEFRSSSSFTRGVSRDAVYQAAMPTCQRITNDTFEIATAIGETGYSQLCRILSGANARQATLACLVLLYGTNFQFQVLTEIADRLSYIQNNRWFSDRESTRIWTLTALVLAQNNHGHYRQTIEEVARRQGLGWREIGRQLIGEAFTYLLNL